MGWTWTQRARETQAAMTTGQGYQTSIIFNGDSRIKCVWYNDKSIGSTAYTNDREIKYSIEEQRRIKNDLSNP